MNFNKHITIRTIYHYNLNEGNYIQSSGNTINVFKIILIDGIKHWYTSHEILEDGSLWELELIIYDEGEPYVLNKSDDWLETTITRKLNRNEKLKQLGI